MSTRHEKPPCCREESVKPHRLSCKTTGSKPQPLEHLVHGTKQKHKLPAGLTSPSASESFSRFQFHHRYSDKHKSLLKTNNSVIYWKKDYGSTAQALQDTGQLA